MVCTCESKVAAQEVAAKEPVMEKDDWVLPTEPPVISSYWGLGFLGLRVVLGRMNLQELATGAGNAGCHGGRQRSFL